MTARIGGFIRIHIWEACCFEARRAESGDGVSWDPGKHIELP